MNNKPVDIKKQHLLMKLRKLLVETDIVKHCTSREQVIRCFEALESEKNTYRS